MNQRSKRARKGKGDQNIGASTMHTGGHVVSHGRSQEPEVRLPQKATGDVPSEKSQGLAKASPYFKKVEDVMPQPKSKSEEKRIIAQATEKPEKKGSVEGTDAD